MLRRRSSATAKLTPRSSSGLPEASWIVDDYLDVVLHVFTPETREYYRLEELWNDVPKLEAAATAPESAASERDGASTIERSGAVAQLGERLAGSQKVRGSSPLGSMNDHCGRLRLLAGKTPAAVVAIDGRPGSGSRGAGRDARPTAGRS